MIGTPKKTFANSNALLYRALILIGLLVAFLTGGFFMGRAYEQSIASPNSPFNFGFCPQQSSSVMVQADGRSAMPASTTTAGVSTAGAGSTGKVTIKVKVSGPGIAKKSMDPICTNTCNKSKNGVCDDGREAGQHNNPGQNFMFVFCDLGTDCNDCGPWQPDVPVTWGQGGEGPIAVLIKKGVEVRVKNTTTPTPYRFAYTDPAHDVDVSAGMDGNGMFETVLTKIFYRIFKNRCIQDKGKRSLFVDVGANFGWYSALASSMGCRVDAFEPVPHFRAFLEYNLHVNNFSPLVTVHACVISNETGKDMEMKVPNRGIWGTAGIGGMNIDQAIKADVESIHVASFRLEDLIKQDVILMKTDVEGWEWSVIKGAMRLLQNYKVENIIMEYSPGIPERNYMHEYSINTVQMLIDLLNEGYKIGHVGWQWIMPVEGALQWGDDIPPMEEVVMGNLKYDMQDVFNIRDGKLGCPLDPVIQPIWVGCGGVPEDQNPRSFRSVIGHNTNILISKNPEILKTNKIAGLFKLDDPVTKYFISDDAQANGHGCGYRPCKHLNPKVQVRHRCPCTDAEVCGEEEKLLKELAEQKRLPSNYVLP